jgi:hypothetical protein
MTLLLLLLTNESVLDDDPGDSDVKSPVTMDHHDEVLLLLWDDISTGGCSVTGDLVASACVAESKGVKLCNPSFSTGGGGGSCVVVVIVAANLSAAACNAVVRVMTGGSVAHGYS